MEGGLSRQTPSEGTKQRMLYFSPVLIPSPSYRDRYQTIASPTGFAVLIIALWWYRIPLAFDGHPISILPHIVASAVTVGIRATRHSIGGPKMLKPLTHFRRNVRELPAVHCDGSGRANCTEHK